MSDDDLVARHDTDLLGRDDADLAVRNDADLVVRHDLDGVATLTLNRPAQRNALSSVLMAALADQVKAIDTDATVRVVVLAGAGSAFCAGHDLREIVDHPDPTFRQGLFLQCSQLMLALTRLRQPVVAKVHGVATAAGCQLVATCDLAVAGASARFATPGVDIGLFCSTPMVALTRAVSSKHAMELLLTGDLVDAPTAERIGLVTRVVPDDELDAAVGELAAKLASKSPLVMAIGKEAFWHQRDLPVDEAYVYASDVMATNLEAADAAEGIDAFLHKRPPTWTGT